MPMSSSALAPPIPTGSGFGTGTPATRWSYDSARASTTRSTQPEERRARNAPNAPSRAKRRRHDGNIRKSFLRPRSLIWALSDLTPAASLAVVISNPFRYFNSSPEVIRLHAASGRRTASGPPNGPNRPSPWPMLRNATVSEEDNHARFCSPAFRNRFHWWNG